MNIDVLKKFFNKRNDIAFAFLYGSQAKKKGTKLSDVDIAVYFYPKNRHPIEFEEEIYYENEDKIWLELEQLLRKEVELLVLNRAPATIAASALRGIPLVIHDWGLYLDFMEVATEEAEDFMNLVIKDYMEKISFEKRDSL